MIDKNINNPWILKEKELLDKLSNEISSNFSISDKLAKKLIYQTHLSLKELKNEIKVSFENKKKNEKNIEEFDEKQLEKLFYSLEWAREIINNSSREDIKELKEILLENLDEFKNNEILDKIFSKKILNSAHNPNNVSEHIMWASLWIVNSTFIIWELLYWLWIWIIKSIPDFILILKWKAELDSFKKI